MGSGSGHGGGWAPARACMDCRAFCVSSCTSPVCGTVESVVTMPISMDHLAEYNIKKTETKEEARARQHQRKEVEIEWRRAIERVIKRYQVATPQTIAACL